MNSTGKPRKSRSLTAELVVALQADIQNGKFAVGSKLPREADLMARFEVSRTVVREAISRLQANGLVETRHGIGTFVQNVLAEPVPFAIEPSLMGAMQDTLAVLELRMGIESEAAALAAMRRSPENLVKLEQALKSMEEAIELGQDAVSADYDFHREIALATQNAHFLRLVELLGPGAIPRARLATTQALDDRRISYLRRVLEEHMSIYAAIRDQDSDSARVSARMHLANGKDRWRLRAELPASEV